MVHPIMTFLNFDSVIQQTSEDRTSCELHESSKIEGTYFSGTFCFVRLLKFKKVHHVGEGTSFWVFLNPGPAFVSPSARPLNPGRLSKGFLPLSPSLNLFQNILRILRSS
jgi:hypothetical protein